MITSVHIIPDVDDSEYLVMGQSYCWGSKTKAFAVYISHSHKKAKGRGDEERQPSRMKKVFGLGLGVMALPPAISKKHAALVRISIAVKRHHDHGSSYKGKHLSVVACNFRGLVHYRHGGKHGDMQANMALGTLHLA